MKVKYHSFNANGVVTATIPKDLVKELKAKWFMHKSQLKKSGIKNFKDYVSTVMMFNST